MDISWMFDHHADSWVLMNGEHEILFAIGGVSVREFLKHGTMTELVHEIEFIRRLPTPALPDTAAVLKGRSEDGREGNDRASA